MDLPTGGTTKDAKASYILQVLPPFANPGLVKLLQQFSPPTPGAVVDHRSDYSLSLWNLLVDLVGTRGEIKEPALAEKLGCSTRLVRWLLKGFQRCNLINVKSYNGQGRGIRITNFWLEKAEKIREKLHWKRAHQKEREYLKTRNSRSFRFGRNRLDCLGIPDGVLTEGSRSTKFFMYKLRTFVENSHLSDHSGVICGKIFNHLEGKTASEGQNWLSRLKQAVMVDWNLVDFFVWFHELAKADKNKCRRLARSKRQRQERKQRKRQARKSFEEDPPPRLKDYDTFDEFEEAVKAWENSKGKNELHGKTGGRTRTERKSNGNQTGAE